MRRLPKTRSVKATLLAATLTALLGAQASHAFFTFSPFGGGGLDSIKYDTELTLKNKRNLKISLAKGDTVITGTGFSSDIRVFVNGLPALVTILSDNEAHIALRSVQTREGSPLRKTGEFDFWLMRPNGEAIVLEEGITLTE